LNFVKSEYIAGTSQVSYRQASKLYQNTESMTISNCLNYYTTTITITANIFKFLFNCPYFMKLVQDNNTNRYDDSRSPGAANCA